MINENFIYLGILINGIGVGHYVILTIKGKIKPNRITFFMFFVAALVAYLSQISQGVKMPSLFTLSALIFPLLIFTSTFFNKKTYWKLKIFDFLCGLFSLMGVLLWQITKVGNIAILFSIFADISAISPTVVKSYNHPKTESGWPWVAASINGLITLLIIDVWTFENYGFVLYFTLINLVVFFILAFKKS